MSNINESIKLASGFLLKNAPVDLKATAADIEERNSYVAAGSNVLYKGAIVYVESEDRFYVYTGVEPQADDYSKCFRALLSGTASADEVAKLSADNTFSGKNEFTQVPTVGGKDVATKEDAQSAGEQAVAGAIGSTVQAHSDQLDKLAALATDGFIGRKTDGSIANFTVEGTAGQLTAAADNAAGKVTLGLANVGNAGSYTKVTTDAQGRVISGENPTTVDDYGITDAVKTSGSTMNGELVLDYDVSSASGKAAVTKEWAESVALGYVHHEAVETAAVSNVEGTYADGSEPGFPGVGATLTITAKEIGGHTLVVGNRVLLAGQTDQKQNGVYVYSSEGKLTRATDLDGKPKISYKGASFLVNAGSLKGSVYTIQEAEAIVFGTDNIVFVKTFTPSEYSAGAGITISNNEVAVAQGTTVQVVNGKLEVASGNDNQGKVLVAGGNGTAASYQTLNLSTLEGTLAVAKGGTGANTLPANQIVLGNGTEAVKSVANAEGLLVGAAGAAPAFGKADLTKHVSGVLPIANGGTGAATAEAAFAAIAPAGATKGDVMYYNGTKWVALGKGKAGMLLQATEDGLAWTDTIDGGLY